MASEHAQPGSNVVRYLFALLLAIGAAYPLVAGCAKALPNTDAVPATDSGPVGTDSGPMGTDSTMTVCGDGVLDMGEECDDANNGIQTDDCLDGCIAASCGDGFVWEGIEQCDDGNANSGDGCDVSCNTDCATFGVDKFGYTACAEVLPVLPCDNLTTLGIDAGLGDEDWAYVPIGFDFDFYGSSYNMVSIGANGVLWFEDAYLGQLNSCIPGANGDVPQRYIAAFWDDLRPGSGQGIVHYLSLGSAPTRRFVVQWQVQRFPSSPDTILVRALLHEGTGNIDICYADPTFGVLAYDNGADATSGIQDSPSLGIEYSCRTPSLTAGLLLRYTHP